MTKASSSSYLARIAGPDQQRGLETEFTRIRELDDAELSKIHAASTLFAKYSTGWSWNETVAACTEFANIVQAAVDVANKSSHEVNQTDILRAERAIREASRLATQWLNEMPKDIARTPQTDILYNIVASATKANSPGAAFLALHAAEEKPLIDLDVQSYLPPSYTLSFNNNFATRVAIPPDIQAVQFVNVALNSMSLVAAAEISVQEETFRQSATLLKSLIAECSYGTPVLAKPPTADTVDTDQFNVTLENLPFNAIEPVMQVARKARATIKSLQASDTPHSMPPQSVAAQTQSIPRTGNAQANDRQRKPPPPVDLSLLFHEIKKLPDELERSWSHALGKQLENDNQTLLKRFQSLFVSIGYAIDERSECLKEAGEPGQIIPAFPLRPQDVEFLSADPTDMQLDLQYAVAELYTAKVLSFSLKPLSAPPRASVDLMSGISNTWWSSGALAQCATSAEAATEMTALSSHYAHSKIHDGADHRNIPDKIDSWLYHAQRAHSAFFTGDIELASLHTARTISLFAAEHEGMPDVLEGEIPEDSRLAISADAARSIVRLSVSLATGKPVRRATLWCLCGYWVGRFEKWLEEWSQRTAATVLNRPIEQTGDEPEAGKK